MRSKNEKIRAVLCLAAGKSQLIVIRKAQALGFAVIAVDRDPNAVGFDLAEEKIVASTYEYLPIVSEVKRLTSRYSISAVLNRSSGPPVRTAAKLTQALNLPGVPPASAEIVLDKGLLMETSRKAGLAVPSGVILSVERSTHYTPTHFPCIVRPSLSLVGKSGVRIVKRPEDFPAALEKAKAASYSGRINVEELVSGRNVSLIGFVSNGALHVLALVDELNGIDESGAVHGVGMVVPSLFKGQDEEKRIISAGERIVNHLDFGTTVCLMSFRCPPGGEPKLIEIHLDMGGDLILDELLPNSTDFDFLSYFIRGLTGETQPVSEPGLRPVAVIFGEGGGLVSDRPFRVLRSESREALETLIVKMKENIHG